MTQSGLLYLVINFECVIVVIEMINSHIAVFSATRIAFTVGMKPQAVNRAKMSPYLRKFFLKNKMKKPSVKLSDFGRCCSNIHGFLSTTQNNMIFVWRNSRGIDWSFRLVRFLIF